MSCDTVVWWVDMINSQLYVHLYTTTVAQSHMTPLMEVIVYKLSQKSTCTYSLLCCFTKPVSHSVELSTSVVLNQVLGEWSSGTFQIKPGDEDIHTANERRLKVSFTVLSNHSLPWLIWQIFLSKAESWAEFDTSIVEGFHQSRRSELAAFLSSEL